MKHIGWWKWLNSEEFLLTRSSAKFEPLKRCGFCICLSCLNQNSIHWPSQARLYDTIQAVIQVSVQLNSKRSTGIVDVNFNHDKACPVISESTAFQRHILWSIWTSLRLCKYPGLKNQVNFYTMYACSQFNNKIIFYNLKWKKQEPNCD